MPELKDQIGMGSWKDADVDWDSYAYADRAREKTRVTKAPKSEETAKTRQEAIALKREQKRKNAAWSDKATRQQMRELRKEKRKRKKAWLKSNETPSTAKGREQEGETSDNGDDWEELAEEERMAKKVRAGKMNKKDFDKMFVDL
jgi:ATP-dependent RNA helicase DDX55/SPB4